MTLRIWNSNLAIDSKLSRFISVVRSASQKALVAGGLLCVAGNLQAQSVGDRVCVIDAVEIKEGNQVVDEANWGMEFTVQEVSGEWIRVSSGHPGWIQKQYVVPTNQAVGYFTRAINADPGRLNLLRGRAHAWQSANEYDNAIEDWTKIIRLSDRPWYGDYSNRGGIFMVKGEYDMAIADYSDALRLVEGSRWRALAYNNRGKAYWHKGDLIRSLADYNAAIRLDPKFSSAFCGRANALADTGDFEAAISDCEQAIRLDPKDSDCYVARGYVRKSQGRFTECLADYAEAIRRAPGSAYAYKSRAWLLATCPDERFRDGTRAVADATRACQLTDWKDGADLDALAAAYAETGDFNQAIKWQTKAMLAGKNSQEFASRLELYQDRLPYRDAPRKKRA